MLSILILLDSGDGSLKSYIENRSLCLGEVAVFDCATDQTSLLWRLPPPIGTVSYVSGDSTEAFTVRGPATMWLLDNVNLTSRLVLSYAPELNNSVITCGSKTQQYIIAGESN